MVKLILKPFCIILVYFLTFSIYYTLLGVLFSLKRFSMCKGINDYESEDEGLGLFFTNHIHSIKFF